MTARIEAIQSGRPPGRGTATAAAGDGDRACLPQGVKLSPPLERGAGHPARLDRQAVKRLASRPVRRDGLGDLDERVPDRPAALLVAEAGPDASAWSGRRRLDIANLPFAEVHNYGVTYPAGLA